MVVLLRDRILRREPEILPDIQRIVKTAPREAFDRKVDIVHPLHDPRAVKFMDQFSRLFPCFIRIYQLYLTGSRNLHLGTLVYVPISMSCDRNRLLPVTNAGLDSFDNDRRPEYRSIQDSTDRPIRALPHFFQIILRHTRRVRCDRRALYRNLVLLGRICRINRNLIVRLISMFKPQVIILRIQLNERLYQMILNHLP